jgi:hypothetical protein
MPSLPVLCPRCKLFFPSRSVHAAAGATDITFAGCSESFPRCGSDADILSGTYEFGQNVVTLLTGPSSSFATLNAIASALDDYRRGKETAEHTKERIERTAPTFGSWLSTQVNHPQFLPAILNVLALIVTALIAANAAIEVARMQAGNKPSAQQHGLEQLPDTNQEVPIESKRKRVRAPKAKPAQEARRNQAAKKKPRPKHW